MGIASSRTRRSALPACGAALAVVAVVSAAALVPASAGARSADAHAARTLSIKESAKLRLDNHKGAVLKEHGYAKGTLSGEIYVTLHVTSTRTVTASITVYPSGGMLGGTAAAKYTVLGSFGRFSGSMNIDKGSGRYAKAHGSGLSFSGKIQRSNDATTVYLSGSFSY